MRTTLYRFFDAQDRLLYVGIAGRPAERAHQHSKEKEWWLEVTRSTYEHFTTREAAAAAEVAAIITEHPLYNVVHNTGRSKAPQRVTFRCEVCDQPIADGTGYVEVDRAFAAVMFRAYGEVDELEPRDHAAADLAGRLADSGRHPNWYALHRKCDPDPAADNGTSYWWPVDRLRTNDDLIAFGSLISEKNWGPFTNIDDFVDFHFLFGAAEAR